MVRGAVIGAAVCAMLAICARPLFAQEKTTMAPEGSSTDLQERLASYWRPVAVPDLKPNVPPTKLPLAPETIGNWAAAQAFVPESARDAFSRNGFAVTDALEAEKVETFYETVRRRGLPVFVTSDSLLHLYHVQFGETLRQIEERKFHDDLLALTRALESKSASLAAKDRVVSEREFAAREICVGYFAVAECLLAEQAKEPALPAVRKELDLIAAHAGFAASPLFKYQEDYSQYVPRGHYTRSEKLRRYFKAMMWHGRMAFLIKGKTPATPDALISEEDAKTQTLAALDISDMLQTTQLPDGRKAREVWDAIYAVTAYYVGFSDDLAPADYRDARSKLRIAGDGSPANVIAHQWSELQKAVAQLRAPEIYGGTGDITGPAPSIATEADLNKALAATQGMRFMGQRFVPDSYVMGRLVYPTVGEFTGGEKAPFTRVMSAAGPVRGFPRGLDVMAILGSARARQILHSLGDDAYSGYDNELDKLRARFGALSEAEWNRNMYWSWLGCLRALPAPAPDGYPTFMRSTAWTDKQLNAALGSWAQLRHDTILYAKQSYTMIATAMGPVRTRMEEGYVEPVPELYARLLALTRMSLKGLDDMKVLDDAGRDRLTALDGILQRLLDVSVRELRNEKLDASDYEFIRSFGAQLKSAVAGVDNEGLETMRVADVHTDTNSGQALEEATGRLRGIAVAYPMPDGSTVVGFGPVFSYYEFKQPMSERLTDEAWKLLLRSPNAPKPAMDQWPMSK
jgi:hypothetical protein